MTATQHPIFKTFFEEIIDILISTAFKTWQQNQLDCKSLTLLFLPIFHLLSCSYLNL